MRTKNPRKIKINLYLTPAEVDELQLHDKNIVVVDVLRAGTSIAAALSNGAREVIPVETVESAVKISGSLFGQVVLLGGERGGKIIEGFHIGNSPMEYVPETVRGKSIVYTTTNGSLAVTRGRFAKRLVVAAFVNVGRVVEFFEEVGEDFTFICAGNRPAAGRFSLEDAVCAGMIVHRIQKRGSKEIELSDSALSALALYRNFSQNILKMIENSEHGRYLSGVGFETDLKICAAVDSIPVLPVVRGNVLKLQEDTVAKL